MGATSSTPTCTTIYEGTEGWTNVHYYRKHFITTPKYLAKARALASSRVTSHCLPATHNEIS